MITLTYSVIAFYFVGQVTVVSGFSGIAGINNYTPGFVGDIVNRPLPPLLHRVSVVALVVYALMRFVVRTPFGLALQGIRDEPVRMSSLGYAVPVHRTLAFGFAAFLAVAGRRAARLVARADRAGRRRPASDHRAAHRRGDRWARAASRARGSGRSHSS